jgi:hypothetical protein
MLDDEDDVKRAQRISTAPDLVAPPRGHEVDRRPRLTRDRVSGIVNHPAECRSAPLWDSAISPLPDGAGQVVAQLAQLRDALLEIRQVLFGDGQNTRARRAPGSGHVENLTHVVEREAKALGLSNEPQFL